MYQYSTARTNLISAAGTRFVWREAGAEHRGIPVVCFSYLMSTMDDWDPAVIDGLAAGSMFIFLITEAWEEAKARPPPPLKKWRRMLFIFSRPWDFPAFFFWDFPWEEW